MSEGPHAGQEDPEEEVKTPTPSTAVTAHSPTLDELLSPIEPTGRFPTRESVAGSDVTDDENRFSTVALSNIIHSNEENEDKEEKEHDNRRDTIAQVDQEREEDGDDETPSKRSSLQKVQEEFARKQQDLQDRYDEENSVDWDFWGNVVSDYQKFASEHPEELASAIGRGIPKTIRGMIWQLMTASKDTDLENTYVRLLKETSPHEKAITRDLGRTFPHHAFFTDGRGIGQENFSMSEGIFTVRSILQYDTQVGYCQGLPFVAAVLLLHMPDEEAFCLLFSFPMNVVFRIFDNVFASGIEALFSFSFVLLLKNEEALLNHTFDKLVSFLNTKVFDVYREKRNGKYDVDRYVEDAFALKISSFMLDSYAQEYEELIRTRNQHAIEMDALRASNRNLSANKQLESSMGQINTEHCELLNELVKARLKHEELESELVRYKLLYAEAMHQSEDAMSSHRISLAMKRSSSNGG
ncbi:rab-GTPase-TBC domain-containing protein [Fomitopsis serialis]|uniref:rab-GTPase-TBC domain-containing protein n=1 Tax=Fomitopsis serialis TaxID=139415 RepID=UPI00200845BF|nr:rab-GTPase-TBC domain-containing protein [Neoantrodia serialis]KAH9935546.1 rab-GTPase-TBC domain-containing protein [Neoantrodia serialis]